MYITTEAIVLAFRKHSDKAMLLSVYTRAGGRREMLVFGAQSKRAVRGQYMPMQPIELTYDEVPNRSIHTLKEARLTCVNTAIDSDIRRKTVALYMAEVLYRTLTLPMEDERLYQWMKDMVRELETREHVEEIPSLFVEGLNRAMGYDVYGEVKEKLKSLTVLTAIMEA